MDIDIPLPLPEDTPLTSPHFESSHPHDPAPPPAADKRTLEDDIVDDDNDQQQPPSEPPAAASGSGKKQRKGKAVDTGAGGDDAEEERKRKQRESNRLAAEKSRSKKREELAILEKTVTNIQQENDRLRSQLEALLAAATNPSTQQPAASTSALPIPSFSIPGVEDGVDPELDDSGEAAITGVTLPHALIPGAAGLNIPHLASLIAEITSLQAQIKDREAALASSSSASAPPAAGDKDTPKDLEREALLITIETLSKEKDDLDLEKAALDREISARKLLLERKKAKEESGEADMEENDDDLEGVGVERALLDVRSWLDDALNGWKKTGIIPTPSSSLPLIPNPPKTLRRKIRARPLPATRAQVAAPVAMQAEELPAEYELPHEQHQDAAMEEEVEEEQPQVAVATTTTGDHDGVFDGMEGVDEHEQDYMQMLEQENGHHQLGM